MKKVKRIAALLMVIFLIAMVFVTLYCAITGSPYFMASLFTMLALPLLIYAYMFIYRIVKDKNEKKYGLNGSPTQVERIFPPEVNNDRQMWTGNTNNLADKIT